MKTAALILFLGVYVLMLALPRFRAVIALGGAACFLLAGILPLSEVPGAIDWNVLLMLSGTMGIVDLFIRSGMPARLADHLVRLLPNAQWVFVALAVFAGLVSSLIDNVATVLMLAPIGLAIAKKYQISPVPVVLAIAVSSNLQGAATLVGDTTSILLGGYLGMSFTDFFVFNGKPGMFWIVQAGALATVPVLLYLFRKDKGAPDREDLTPVSDYVPTILLVGMVAALIATSFLPTKLSVTNGLVCMGILAVGLLWECLHQGTVLPVRLVARSIDYPTLLLLSGLFLLIKGLTLVGVIDDIGTLFLHMGGGSLFRTYTLIVWLSVLLSAFIDNIPYVATMLPVVGSVSAALGLTSPVLYFGLLAGATLGGNLTPIGASANIAAGGILRREGYQLTTREFLKIGVPFTLAAVMVGYLLIWLIY